jgi:SNF2 family DNA or RNA helicase
LRAAESLIRTIMERAAECGLCVACFEGPISRRLVAPCGHAFCEACGAKPPSECPVCGAGISDGLRTSELEAPRGEAEEGPNKLECLLEIVERSGPAAKILLFSKHVRIYRKIQAEFRSRGVPYADLEGGSQAVIDDVVRDFKRGKVKVLMVDSSLFACGLNIETTTDVIMLHKMDEHTEKQVVGRAQRPGRTCRLSVWHLLNRNEWEPR